MLLLSGRIIYVPGDTEGIQGVNNFIFTIDIARDNMKLQ